MGRATKSIDVRRITPAEYIDELREAVAAYERRYRCSSQEMLDAVRAGKAEETMEVARWLFEYRSLTRAEEQFGRTTGTPTTTT